MVMLRRRAFVTVTVSVPLMAPTVAVTVAVPAALVVTVPAPVPEATTVRTAVSLDDHVAVAANAWLVSPRCKVGVVGVMAMLTSFLADTVIVLEFPEILPIVAVA